MFIFVVFLSAINALVVCVVSGRLVIMMLFMILVMKLVLMLVMMTIIIHAMCVWHGIHWSEEIVIVVINWLSRTIGPTSETSREKRWRWSSCQFFHRAKTLHLLS